MILVDDGSPEQSWRVVQAYSWIDPRIRAVRQIHGGACIARNTGVADARGKYLLFLDADDWLEPDALSRLTSACETDALDAAHGPLRYVSPEGYLTAWEGGFDGRGELFDAICGSNVLSVPSSVLLRRSVLTDIGLFDPTLVHCGDWDLWARLARHGGAIGRVEGTITNYRMRPGSLSRSPKTLLRDAMTVLKRAHAPDPRVLRPRPEWENGADPKQLASRTCHFATYAAGLAICSRDGFEAACDLLDAVVNWVPLSPRRAAEFVFYATCFAHCCGPEGVADFWPNVMDPLHALLDELERRTASPGLARRMFEEMNAFSPVELSSLPLPLPLPEPVELTHRSAEVATDCDTLPHSLLRLLAGQGA
jgi:glycosyltransferase involved in cell wall biosynthesis